MSTEIHGLDMDELESAEDFMEYFSIDYDHKVVHVNRLHILQRFHNYISEVEKLPIDKNSLHTLYQRLLENAYADFVSSDALTEKVFKVFHRHKLQQAFVPLADIKLPGIKLQG